RVGAGLELCLADLAQEAEELAAEGALRIAPRGFALHLEAGKLTGPLLQVRGESGGRVGDDDGGCEGRLQDLGADACREEAPAPAGDACQAAERLEARRTRAPDSVSVPGAERGR